MNRRQWHIFGAVFVIMGLYFLIARSSLTSAIGSGIVYSYIILSAVFFGLGAAFILAGLAEKEARAVAARRP